MSANETPRGPAAGRGRILEDEDFAKDSNQRPALKVSLYQMVINIDRVESLTLLILPISLCQR
jgi:hypothetical protein